MFHCNGWCFPWTIAARAGINVCLRRVDAQHILRPLKSMVPPIIVQHRSCITCLSMRRMNSRLACPQA
jgi:hypothetical protein